MIMVIGSIWDDKAKCYSRPFFAQAIGALCRGFEDAVNDAESPYGKHPADYTLFAIGTFDDATGKLAPEDTPQNLGSALQYVRKELSRA